MGVWKDYGKIEKEVLPDRNLTPCSIGTGRKTLEVPTVESGIIYLTQGFLCANVGHVELLSGLFPSFQGGLF